MADLLRALEATRRQLAIATRGRAGVFPGFFRLQVNPSLETHVNGSGPVMVRVTITSEAPQFVSLDLSAWVNRRVDNRCQPEVLASGCSATIYPRKRLDEEVQPRSQATLIRANHARRPFGGMPKTENV